ncbi:hypothetical protein GCM10010275_29590 [Streptomyces litmocidini]|nr:hypothetical protein GCM10010275_29590 [Streptomyces litmocidini]
MGAGVPYDPETVAVPAVARTEDPEDVDVSGGRVHDRIEPPAARPQGRTTVSPQPYRGVTGIGTIRPP